MSVNKIPGPVAPNVSSVPQTDGAKKSQRVQARSTGTVEADGRDNAKTPTAPAPKDAPKAALAQPKMARSSSGLRRTGAMPNGAPPLVDGDARTAPTPEAEHIVGHFDNASEPVRTNAQQLLNHFLTLI